MKKKTTHHEFKNSTFDVMWDVDIKPKKHNLQSDYDNYNTRDEEVSPDILKLMNHDDFSEKLYDFVRNYNEKYKTLKMKKEHQKDEGWGETSSMMTVCLEVRNGVGCVSWFPLLEDEHEYEKKMWGDFKIKKVDMMKFINDFSKKVKFQYNPIKSFEFSWCLDDIEEINEDDNTYNEDCDYILKKLMKTKQISKGERCKGVVSWDETKSPREYKVDYTYCSDLGEDWDSDVWVDKVVKIKLK